MLRILCDSGGGWRSGGGGGGGGCCWEREMEMEMGDRTVIVDRPRCRLSMQRQMPMVEASKGRGREAVMRYAETL
jgi:hypothetical protein